MKVWDLFMLLANDVRLVVQTNDCVLTTDYASVKNGSELDKLINNTIIYKVNTNSFEKCIYVTVK